MNIRSLLILGSVLILVAGQVLAGRIEEVSESFEVGDAENIVIEGDFSVGELRILTSDMSEVAIFDIEYDKRKIRYYADYDTRGKTGYVDFGSEMKRSFNSGNVVNEWDILLSTKYSTRLILDMGACEVDIDLGGLPLTELELDIGAASGRIEFSSKNPERLEEMDIDIGASSVKITKLGNANFEYFDFNCGAASAELDFSGDYSGQGEVQIDVGVGSADISIPRDLEVRIITDDSGWLSSIDFHHDDLKKVRRGTYETKGYRDAKTRLLIEVDVGMGSVDFYFD